MYNNTRLMALCPGLTTRESRYQKGKTNLDLLELDSEWQWHQLDHMQICTLLQKDNQHIIQFLQAGCPTCAQPTASKHSHTV